MTTPQYRTSNIHQWQWRVLARIGARNVNAYVVRLSGRITLGRMPGLTKLHEQEGGVPALTKLHRAKTSLSVWHQLSGSTVRSNFARYATTDCFRLIMHWLCDYTYYRAHQIIKVHASKCQGVNSGISEAICDMIGNCNTMISNVLILVRCQFMCMRDHLSFCIDCVFGSFADPHIRLLYAIHSV